MSDADLELERLRRAFAARTDRAAPPAGCPPAERLWSAVHGELPPDEVRPLVAHLADCAACAEAWRLAREMDSGVAEQAVSAAPPPRAWGRWAALAAGLAAVMVGAALLQPRLGSTPEYRAAPGAVPGEIRSLLPESRALPRGRFQLRWTAGPEAATYTVQVATERLEPVAEARGLTATEYVVPPEKLAAVPAGEKLLWRVEATTPDGARVGSVTFVSRVE